jgi:hypothetical protein
VRQGENDPAKANSAGLVTIDPKLGQRVTILDYSFIPDEIQI